jgi:hypothetical protein
MNLVADLLYGYLTHGSDGVDNARLRLAREAHGLEISR